MLVGIVPVGIDRIVSYTCS